MPNLGSVTTNFFATASETFTDNLSASIAAGAATVPVNSAVEYTNGDVVALTVDPGTVNEATFIGVKNGSQFENCVWTEGNTAVGHSSGATIIDYDSATHHAALIKGLLKFANQDGSLKTQPVRDALGLGTTAANGWEVLPATLSVSSGYDNGNRSFNVTIANYDARTVLSEGMRLKATRGTTAPTQCADFESSSSQYATRVSASVAGDITAFTDDWTAEAWINLESYAQMAIVSRAAGTSGWALDANASGQVRIYGQAAGNGRQALTYMSLELSRWTHIAATLDMSGSLGTIYLNGISVPLAVSNLGAGAAALTNTGDLQIGATAGAQFFDGKISDVRVWKVARTQTQIRDNRHQQLTGSESNLVGYWKLNGDFNDSTSNANHLTAQGGVVATTLDNPMNNPFMIIQSVSYSAPNSTLVVQCPEGYEVPNMTLSAAYYSSHKAPFGMPISKDKFRIASIYKASETVAIGAVATWTASNFKISVPVGRFTLGYQAPLQLLSTVAGVRDGNFTVASAPTNAVYSTPLTAKSYLPGSNAASIINPSLESVVALSSQTIHSLYGSIVTATGSESYIILGANGQCIIYADVANL